MTLNIGIIDADLLDEGTTYPNLALMKISGFYKNQLRANVSLLLGYEGLHDFDKVFVSKVFSYNNVPSNLLQIPNVQVGGTGFYPEGDSALPTEIEFYMPDYSLYEDYVSLQVAKGRDKKRFSNYLDFSVGFTTRGCFRKCGFCVNKRYDRVVKHSKVSDFLDTTRYGIHLWDDNFLGCAEWENILDELDQTGKPFQFKQGLDIRLMDERKAQRILRCKSYGDYIFAFDNILDREYVERGLRIWRRYAKKTTKLYLLCAYYSQDEKDIESLFIRIQMLMQYQCIPFVTKYELYNSSRFKALYTAIARWCNQPHLFKKKSFREFCELNQEYVRTVGYRCAAYRAMQNFELEFPLLAKKYFDLRYDKEGSGL